MCPDVDLDDPASFLGRLDLGVHDPSVGEALRTCPARDLIAATFGVASRDVPGGFLRAILRIREGDSPPPGVDPFAEPRSYRQLWEIFTTEPHGTKAKALRYCGHLTSALIRAVDLLDPVLVRAEILRHVSTPERVRRANALLNLLRTSISAATDEDLSRALQASLASGTPLEHFARKAVEKADRFPPPPLRPAEDVRPLTSAPALIAFGAEMHNCVASKIGEILLGVSYVYRVEHRHSDGALTVLAVELAPLSNGSWAVKEIKLARNRRPSNTVLHAALRRLHALGAVSHGSASEHSRALADLLGVWRWETFDLSRLEDCLAEAEQGA